MTPVATCNETCQSPKTITHKPFSRLKSHPRKLVIRKKKLFSGKIVYYSFSKPSSNPFLFERLILESKSFHKTSYSIFEFIQGNSQRPLIEQKLQSGLFDLKKIPLERRRIQLLIPDKLFLESLRRDSKGFCGFGLKKPGRTLKKKLRNAFSLTLELFNFPYSTATIECIFLDQTFSPKEMVFCLMAQRILDFFLLLLHEKLILVQAGQRLLPIASKLLFMSRPVEKRARKFSFGRNRRVR